MRFLFPLGFLALIGIPVLILIYIIKNRYTEQTVTSTYLWTLSEKFLKRRVPINRITGILSLILQILSVVAIALILTHPIIAVPGAADAYCFIIDGSGSMNIVEDGKTRFESGKEEIAKIIDDAMPGSIYTYVLAGNTTATVFENNGDKERAKTLVNDSSVSYVASGLTDALATAQSYFDDFPYAKIYLVTDKNYEDTQNVQVVKVGSAVENYALSDVEQDLSQGTVNGDLVYYGNAEDAPEVSVDIYYDGDVNPRETKTAKCKSPEEADPENATGIYVLKQITLGGNTYTSGTEFDEAKEIWRDFRLTSDGKIFRGTAGESGTWQQKQGSVSLQYAGLTVTASIKDNRLTFEEGGAEVVLEKERSFGFVCSNINFATARLKINKTDALDLDNEVIIYRVENQNMAKILLVSDNPFFAENLLNANGIYDRSGEENAGQVAGEDLLDIVGTKEYPGEGGYGLYIFDCSPSDNTGNPVVNTEMNFEMPKDGAVWIINPQSNFQNSSFSWQDAVKKQNDSDGSEGVTSGALGAIFPQASGRSSTVEELLKGLDTDVGGDNFNFHLNGYSRLSVTGKYYELATCNDDPVIFTGANGYGNREVVFAFDLRASADLILSGNMVLLFSNLISYSFPQVVNSTSYYCGDTLSVNMIAGCRSIRIETPEGNVSYPDTSTAVSEYTLEEVGTYKVFLIMKDETERMVNVYSSLPVAERNPDEEIESVPFNVRGTPQESNLAGIIDNLLIIIFIVLAVIIVADYGVYCYEQYQLR